MENLHSQSVDHLYEPRYMHTYGSLPAPPGHEETMCVWQVMAERPWFSTLVFDSCKWELSSTLFIYSQSKIHEKCFSKVKLSKPPPPLKLMLFAASRWRKQTSNSLNLLSNCSKKFDSKSNYPDFTGLIWDSKRTNFERTYKSMNYSPISPEKTLFAAESCSHRSSVLLLLQVASDWPWQIFKLDEMIYFEDNLLHAITFVAFLLRSSSNQIFRKFQPSFNILLHFGATFI